MALASSPRLLRLETSNDYPLPGAARAAVLILNCYPGVFYSVFGRADWVGGDEKQRQQP